MKKPPPSRQSLTSTFLTQVLWGTLLFFIPSYTIAQQHDGTGFMVSIDAGALFPSDKQANFYDGRDGRPNTILRVLHSEAYGHSIWQSLKNGGYITDAVGSYTALTVDEWPDMYYKTSFQIGFGLRYGFRGGWGGLLRVDYARLTAVGAWNLSATNGTGILSDRGRYIRCGVYGLENRIMIDLGITKQFQINDSWSIGIEGGIDINNTKVKEHEMEIAGRRYSILDIWDGASPSAGTGSYEYINQGGIGYGYFSTLVISYGIPGYGSLDLGFSCYYTQTRYPDYNDDDAFAVQNVLFLRANLYNFFF